MKIAFISREVRVVAGVITNKLAIACALLAAILYIIPWRPFFPVNTLDASWALGLNQAVAQRLRFGEEITFTFGPYASVYTHQYHPAVARLMFLGSALVAAAFCGGVLRLITPKQASWLWLLPLFLAASITPNAFFYAVPVMLVCIVGRTQLSAASQYRVEINPATVASVLLLNAALALIALSKGSFVVPAFVSCLLSMVLVVQQCFPFALSIGATFITALVTAWLYSGQSIVDLPGFFAALLPIVSGHTDAMSQSGPIYQVIAYLVATVLMTGVFFVKSCFNEKRSVQLITVLAFLLAFFFAFKAGFVRHDSIHVAIAGEALLLLGFVGGLQMQGRGKALILLISVAACTVLEAAYVGNVPAELWTRVRGFYVGGIVGVSKFATEPQWADERYEQTLAAIRRKNPVSLDGTTDIYSYNQVVLIANNLLWSPRPTLQSYMAYSPRLALQNAQHLQGAHAPQNIIFKLQTIDNRYPALDDGLSWPAIIENYMPIGAIKSGLLLRRKSAEKFLPADFSLNAWDVSHSYSLGTEVDLPYREGKWLWVALDVKPSLAGKAFSFLYKLPELEMTIQRRDGVAQTFRLIASSARAGFLLSPYIGDTPSFQRLFERDGLASMTGLSVEKIRVTASPGATFFWNDVYQLNAKFIDQ